MMRLPRNACAVLLLLLTLPALAGAPPWHLRFDGIGPLKVGMDWRQAESALGRPMPHTRPELLATPGCEMVAVPGHPHVWLMFIADVLQRVDIEAGSGVRTVAGVAPGEPVARVLAAYPGVESGTQAYDERERYLTVHAPDGANALRFETGQGKVGRAYAGQWKVVQYVEGCL
jgi:hypothetical protein